MRFNEVTSNSSLVSHHFKCTAHSKLRWPNLLHFAVSGNCSYQRNKVTLLDRCFLFTCNFHIVADTWLEFSSEVVTLPCWRVFMSLTLDRSFFQLETISTGNHLGILSLVSPLLSFFFSCLIFQFFSLYSKLSDLRKNSIIFSLIDHELWQA